MADLDRNVQHTEEKVLSPITVFYFTNRQLQIYVRNAWNKTSKKVKVSRNRVG